MKVRKRYVAAVALIVCGVAVAFAIRGLSWASKRDSTEPVHQAAYQGDLSELRFLIWQGVDLETRATVEATDWLDVTPMHIAAEQNHVDVIRLLASAGVNIDAADGQEWSPLMTAVQRCSSDAASTLLGMGADPQGVARKYPPSGVPKPFQVALEQCKVNIAAEFLRYGSPIELGGEAALTWVDGPDRVAKLQLLLSYGLEVDALDWLKDKTALVKASFAGDVRAVRLLLDRGADVNKPDRVAGLTPVFWAARAGANRVVELLLDSGADPNRGTDDYGSLVYIAAFNGRTSTVRILLERDLGIDLALGRTLDGATPLHFAYSFDDPEMIWLLLEAGADPTIRTTDGRTPEQFRK